jgi:hypothetical protein
MKKQDLGTSRWQLSHEAKPFAVRAEEGRVMPRLDM